MFLDLLKKENQNTTHKAQTTLLFFNIKIVYLLKNMSNMSIRQNVFTIDLSTAAIYHIGKTDYTLKLCI